MPFRKVDEGQRVQQAIEKEPTYEKFINQSDYQYELIKNLVAIRKELKLSQSDVAKKSGLTQQMVSRIEKLDNSPTLENLMKYITALNVTLKVVNKHSDEEVCALEC